MQENTEQKKEPSMQQMAMSGGNSTQAGRDINEVNTTNTHVFIGIFLIVILALGGLAWAVTVGFNQGGQNSENNQEEILN